MSLHNRIITRRALLKLIAQLSVIIAGSRVVGVTGVALLRPPCPGMVYGSGAYGRGCYSGCCVPSGRVYLPMVRKGGR